jgi:murein L,D-transpeptidase YafK
MPTARPHRFKGKLALLVLLLAVVGVSGFMWRGEPPCNDCVTTAIDLIMPEPDLPALPYAMPPEPVAWSTMPVDQRLADAQKRLLPHLKSELAKRQAKLGNAAFICAFKEERKLELWLKTGEDWTLFRTYPIAALSGNLGPKLAEGDWQTPEGFYGVNARALNPASSFHLSFNIGYPNEYDLQHQRTGTLIMVHGSDVSVGCLAMTDPAIEEIYWVVSAAIEAGQQEVPVHIFPFRMTEAKMRLLADSDHIDFWRELKAGYDWFETRRQPPVMEVIDGHYRLNGKI